MPLSPEERAALVKELEADGVTGDRAKAILRAAEDGEESAGEKPEARADESPEAKPATSAEPPKVFQYHLPFLRVRELRKLIGFTESVDDDDALCGEWLAKHGGALAGGGGGGSAPPAPTE